MTGTGTPAESASDCRSRAGRSNCTRERFARGTPTRGWKWSWCSRLRWTAGRSLTATRPARDELDGPIDIVPQEFAHGNLCHVEAHFVADWGCGCVTGSLAQPFVPGHHHREELRRAL